MDTKTLKRPSIRRPWIYPVFCFVVTIALWPFGAAFYSPNAIGYVQEPGVIIFLGIAVVCVTCFIKCPRRPIMWKSITLMLAAHGIFWALYGLSYLYLNYWFKG